MQGILNQQDALEPSSPSFRRTTSHGIAWLFSPISHRRKQVANDSPGYSRDAETSSSYTLQGKAGENGQPGGCLCKSSLQETVGYAGGKLPAGVANDWVTRRSPVPCFADLRVITPRVPPSLPLRRPPLAEGGARRIACTVWWLNVQSGLQDPGNNTPGILQSA